MPLDGNQVASKPAGTTAVPNTVVASAPYNATVDDIYNIFNTKVQPVAGGGTGGTTAAGARDALGLEIGNDIPSFAAASGMLYGLTLSNNGADASNDIDVAAGSAIDLANAHVMTLASALTKRIDAAWAVGTNQGGLDGTESVAGTPDVSTWYYVWLIKRTDTGVVDVLFSESATTPTMPTGYTLKRRIGAVYNDSAGTISQFTQVGDDFLLTDSINSYSTNDPGTAAVTVTLRVPTGFKVRASGRFIISNASAVTGSGLILSSLDQADESASSANMMNANAGTFAGGSNLSAGDFSILTNVSGQIRARLGFSSADVTLTIRTTGWTDTRGRLA